VYLLQILISELDILLSPDSKMAVAVGEMRRRQEVRHRLHCILCESNIILTFQGDGILGQ
jgi:3-oxoacyl-ACP reductase-like protein